MHSSVMGGYKSTEWKTKLKLAEEKAWQEGKANSKCLQSPKTEEEELFKLG